MMIDRIKWALSQCKNIDGFKIVEKRIESNELFFIKKNIDMNRIKNVHKFKVEVYREFEEAGVKYNGSSFAIIYPTMQAFEIKEAIDNAAFSAKFVKNPYYPLLQENNISRENEIPVKSALLSLDEYQVKFAEAIYSSDVYKNGWINSSELFLNNIYTRIINSKGLDVCYTNFEGQIEFISNWREDKEEIEVYKDINFSEFDSDRIQNCVKEYLSIAKSRAKALSMPDLKKCTIVLTKEPVVEFLKYYYFHSGAQAVYEGTSNAKIAECIQGENVIGDKITLRHDPYLKNSTFSVPYDDDGTLLKEMDIIKDGVLTEYWGNIRYSYYLGVKPSGSIKNIIVNGGSKSLNEMKIDPYLELVLFSDFQMDNLTGDFGGEVRLGWYFDGKNRVPVTNFSISGNINEVQKNMYLSKEISQINSFVGPTAIQLFNISVSAI